MYARPGSHAARLDCDVEDTRARDRRERTKSREGAWERTSDGKKCRLDADRRAAPRQTDLTGAQVLSRRRCQDGGKALANRQDGTARSAASHHVHTCSLCRSEAIRQGAGVATRPVEFRLDSVTEWLFFFFFPFIFSFLSFGSSPSSPVLLFVTDRRSRNLPAFAENQP